MTIPEGYKAFPIGNIPPEGVLRLAVLVKNTPEPGAGHLVLLRDVADARIYLGCLVDAEGVAQEWVELWVQDVDGLDSSLPGLRENFNNHMLDQRWISQSSLHAKSQHGLFLRTGWEGSHPSPQSLDMAKALVMPLESTDGHADWRLCTDDKILQQAGLPAYTTSLFRYLFAVGTDGSTKFIPVVSGAPTNNSTIGQPAYSPGANVDFNPQGGLLMATRFCPLSYEDYVDTLGGKPWEGIEHGRRKVMFGEPYSRLAETEVDAGQSRNFLTGNTGRAGRVMEVLHLKLALLLRAVGLVRDAVHASQAPMLNLSGDSFRVRLHSGSVTLPCFWTAETALVKPGSAFPLPVDTSEFRYFIRARSETPSMYLPEGISSPVQGMATVRIRQVLPPDQSGVVIEGTMVLQEKVAVSAHDLLWIRLPLSSPTRRVDLYGHIYATESLAQGEVRFRTVAQRLDAAVVADLQKSAGVAFARSPFEVVPLLSSPCDLYAMGALAVRTLLVDHENPLAIALDEMLSFARQLGAEHSPDVTLRERVSRLLQRDARFTDSLGAHRLMRGILAKEDVLKLVPASLWHDALGWMAQLFPGLGPDSVCRDYGDVPALALENVFDRPLEELERLVATSRSAVFVDWQHSKEIRGIISGVRSRMGA